MYRILIAGAGYTGGAIARFFASKKQKVYALTRSAEKAARFQAEGLHPVVMDFGKPDTMKDLPEAQFVVIAAAPDERTEEAYERTYIQGIGHFLGALKNNPKPLLIVYLSSTGVWSDLEGGWVDESMPAKPDTERGRILLRAEQQVIESGFPSVILRLAGIYGPGRNRLEIGRKTADASGAPEVPRWMNMIHVEDIAQAMPLIFKKAEEGSIMIGVDDEPVASPEFYSWMKQNTPLKQSPVFLDKPPVGKRLRNTLLKSLGYSFKHPTFREGYASFF